MLLTAWIVDRSNIGLSTAVPKALLKQICQQSCRQFSTGHPRTTDRFFSENYRQGFTESQDFSKVG